MKAKGVDSNVKGVDWKSKPVDLQSERLGSLDRARVHESQRLGLLVEALLRLAASV
jgi:hypothetical protein